MSVAALIVAAGRGARAAGESGRPKQYCPIGGVPMLTRTIGAFAAHPSVDDILVVIHPDDAALYAGGERGACGAACARPCLAARGGRTRCAPGSRRWRGEAPSSVLIHDAARPFVDAPS